MEHLPVAREMMRRPCCVVSPEMDIYAAMAALRDHGAAVAMVCERAQLIGILTEKDCLRVLSVNAYEGVGVVNSGTVQDYMSRISTVLHPEMDLFAVASAFLERQFIELPVLEEGRLIGTISRRAVVEAILRVQREIIERQILQREWQRIVLQNPETKQAVTLMVTHQPPQMPLHV